MPIHRITLLLALLAIPSAGLAQDQEPPKEVEKPSASVELKELQSAANRLAGELRTATGENRDIVGEQFAEARGALFEKVDGLLGGDKVKAALEDAATKRVLRSIVSAESGRLRREAKRLERDLTKRFASLDRLKGAELIDAEQGIADSSEALDQTLKSILKNTEREAALGMPTEADLAALDKELKARADRLSGTIRSTMSKIERLGKREVSNPDDKKATQDQVQALQSRLESMIASLKQTIELMKGRKLEVSEYQQLMIEATGDISTDILDADVALGLLGKYTKKTKAWFVDNGPAVLFKLILGFLIFLFAKLVARLVEALLSRALRKRRKSSELFRSLVVGLAGKVVVLAGVLVALWQFGFSLAPMLAGLGIAGLVVGLALQDTLSSVASGVMILVYRPFDTGDLIEVSGQLGEVSAMNLMATTLQTPANERIMIPNNKIWGDVIKNVTGVSHRRVDMMFGIAYSDDVDRAQSILRDILKDTPQVLEKPEPIVRVHELADSSVNFAVRPFVKPDDYWEVFWTVTEQVKKRFDAEGVSIPFPQRDVHVIKPSGDQAA